MHLTPQYCFLALLDEHQHEQHDEQQHDDEQHEEHVELEECGSPARSSRSSRSSSRFHTPTVPADTPSPIATRLRVNRTSTTNDDKMLADWGWVDPTTVKKELFTVSEAEYAELLDQGTKIVKLIQEKEHPELMALLTKLPPLTKHAKKERNMAVIDYGRLKKAEKDCLAGGTYTVKVRSRLPLRSRSLPLILLIYSSTYSFHSRFSLSPSWAKKASTPGKSRTKK